MVEESNATDMIARAELAAEKLRQQNELAEQIMKRQIELESQRILGGKAAAGEPPKEKVVETPQEYAKRMLRGGI